MDNTNQNTLIEYFTRGKFRSYDDLPFKEIDSIADEIAEIQNRYHLQTNLLQNIYQDGKVGRILGFNLVNTDSNGADCKHEKQPLFLEVKKVQLDSDSRLSIQINFGNTNIAKTEMFKDKKLFLAAAAWEDVNTIAFIIFGQHEEIGSFLQTQLQKSIQAKTKNKQSISLQSLITQYHFKIIPISRTKQELLDIFKNTHSAILTQIKSSIIELKDFDLLKNLSSYQKCTSQDNPDLSWFSSDSHFINYNDLPYIQLDDIFSRLSKIQKDYDIKNMHTIFNWYHDGTAGKALGFDQINVGGGGVDCKTSNNDLFLEVKSIQWDAAGYGASFSDLSPIKVEAFLSDKMYLAVSVFSDINTLQFIVFGQNKYIGKYMELILQNKKHCAIFSIPTLLRRYGFKILPISISKEVLVQMMISTNKSFTEKELNKYIVSRDDDFDITKFKYATNVSDLEAIEIT